jgi:hypothetical protein
VRRDSTRCSCYLSRLLNIRCCEHPRWRKCAQFNIARPMRITPAVAAAYLTNQSCGSGTLFDSVLFTEIKSPSGAYYWPGPDRRGATQGEWRDFADSLFAPGFNISALESAAEKEFGTAVDHSGKKISVYISMPVPDSRLRDWGSVDGKRLDLSSDKDRIAAVMWYVNEIDRHWKSLSLGAITLAGYYWNAESVDDAASIMPGYRADACRSKVIICLDSILAGVPGSDQ